MIYESTKPIQDKKLDMQLQASFLKGYSMHFSRVKKEKESTLVTQDIKCLKNDKRA